MNTATGTGPTGIVPTGAADRLSPNQWIPTSPCGRHCVGHAEQVSGLRIAVRLTAFLSIAVSVLTVGVATLLLPRGARLRYWRRGARLALRTMGVRLDVEDQRPAHARRVRGALVVANHVSFLDIVAMAAVAPARFVAKTEVLEMPGFAPIARAFGVLPHTRGDLRALAPMIAKVTDILDRGRTVAVFPEGTTWCGAASGRFRPAFFQAAVDAGVPVLPMRVAYSTGGRPTTLPGFIGEDTVATTFRRILVARDLHVTVTVFDLQLPVPDRKRLAADAQRVVVPATDLSDRIEMVPLPPLPAADAVRALARSVGDGSAGPGARTAKAG